MHQQRNSYHNQYPDERLEFANIHRIFGFPRYFPNYLTFWLESFLTLGLFFKMFILLKSKTKLIRSMRTAIEIITVLFELVHYFICCEKCKNYDNFNRK